MSSTSASFSSSAAPATGRKGRGGLRVGGLVPLSTTDYPGRLAAVVFCQGCPWRCRYCHNPHLLPRRGTAEIAWAGVLALLERRRGLLDAVVFSGGEPTLQSGLAAAMRDAKALGFRIGLHTAGIAPRRLAQVLPLVDWVGIDVKAPFANYAKITGVPGSGGRALQSVRLILDSGVDYEFRTTVHASLLPPAALTRLTQLLARLGVRNYVLQEFRAQGCASATLRDARSYLTDAFCRSLAARFSSFSVRRAQ